MAKLLEYTKDCHVTQLKAVKNTKYLGYLAGLVEHVTLNIGSVSSSPMLGEEIT